MTEYRINKQPIPEVQELPPINNRTPRHVFDRESVLAVSAAMACGRPLLVRGEPGTGKSQLAVAVAMALERVPMVRVVDARTEPHDLMWEYDAVGRLADAQAYGALCEAAQGAPKETAKDAPKDPGEEAPKVLRPTRERYVVPGPLWWAFNWDGAQAQARDAGAKIVAPPKDTDPKNGVVLLIDEIDKADMAVPNALLECLGSGRFHVPGVGEVAKQTTEPLVMLTTNTDRALPDAFVRRCVVLHMRVPKDRVGLVQYLVERGEKNFPEMAEAKLSEAANKVADDRAKVSGSRIYCPPGLAEYIDLLTALKANDELELKDIARYVLSKHRDPGPLGQDV